MSLLQANRDDYPQQDDQNWLKWVIVKKIGNRMVVDTESIPIERYHIKPGSCGCP